MGDTSLKKIFDLGKEGLIHDLQGLTLPKDAQKVQTVVSNHLGAMLENDSEFRQNLTQSEDYILQAAITLLNAQKQISVTLTKNIHAPEKPCKKLNVENASQQMEGQAPHLNQANPSYSLIGAAGGALAGKLLLGGWGAVFGAIAGVALSVYYSSSKQQPLSPVYNKGEKKEKEEEANIPLNVNAFVEIIHNVCDSVDNLIETFRAQVNRISQRYESQEKPSLDKEYRPLLENIQSLVGYKRNHTTEEEKYTRKLQERIEDLAESLDNYDITLENYSEDNARWFDQVPSPNTTKLKEVFPAVVKKGNLVIPGKIFIPE